MKTNLEEQFKLLEKHKIPNLVIDNDRITINGDLNWENLTSVPDSIFLSDITVNGNLILYNLSSIPDSNFLSNFDELKKYNFHIITEDSGFIDAYDNLWLMSHCVNHIISNSTFYWWGAYFSSTKYKNQTVICAENFVNKDTCLDHWKLNFYN
jgi:hypothetical protein